jgi:hypothetical protein
MAEPAPLADAIGVGGGGPIDFSRWDGREAFIRHIDADIVPSPSEPKRQR